MSIGAVQWQDPAVLRCPAMWGSQSECWEERVVHAEVAV